jgi:hypothetical protein
LDYPVLLFLAVIVAVAAALIGYTFTDIVL